MLLKNIRTEGKTIIYIVFFILILGCNKKKSEDELKISYKGYEVYLKMSRYADAEPPPIYHVYFDVTNTTNETKVFVTKSWENDKTLSKMYLLDTLKNIIVPIYSTSKNIIEREKIFTIDARIKIKDFQKYFNLANEFFEKNDFTEDKKLLNKMFVNMINQSIIIYEQDSSDISQYKILNSKVTPLKNNFIVKINKNKIVR